MEISDMTTPHLENAISYIDEHLPDLIQQKATLSRFRAAKTEMLREIGRREVGQARPQPRGHEQKIRSLEHQVKSLQAQIEALRQASLNFCGER
jgi:prefoldin subunit 5